MITSQLEIIKQAQTYLASTNKVDYTLIITPNFISSAGAHIRHIIDHYLAIITGMETDTIDYDIRSRGGKVEEDPAQAMAKLNEISEWIKQLSPDELAKTINLSTEVSVSSQNVQTVTTSVARELVFAGGHAVHHYAMIAQITFAQTSLAETTLAKNSSVKESNPVKIPANFGLAPATATFLRQQKEHQEEKTLATTNTV